MVGNTYFSPERFEAAQKAVFADALAELKAGRKSGHWMWFIFPQLKGLGRSAMADLFGLASLEEARMYLAHPVLGARLHEATEAVLAAPSPSLRTIFGSPDDLKFRSSMTLFAEAAGTGDTVYRKALEHWCNGEADQKTLDLLKIQQSNVR
ncbi:MAG TPA: DUF1810 domain-containing protein [Asticcacaulis sp.]|nr:DUF1810 domain-containing protein [Asticcacaulis sp.]